jgi:hypothetical protein
MARPKKRDVLLAKVASLGCVVFGRQSGTATRFRTANLMRQLGLGPFQGTPRARIRVNSVLGFSNSVSGLRPCQDSGGV